MAVSFILNSLGFINCFAFKCSLIISTIKFNLEAALHTNGVIEGDVKEVIKKQLDNAPKQKDDEKTQMMQIIGLIRPMLT